MKKYDWLQRMDDILNINRYLQIYFEVDARIGEEAEELRQATEAESKANKMQY